MSNTSKGLAYMAVASFFFATMGLFVKLCAGIPTVQIVFFRGVVAMFFCLIHLRIKGVSPWGNNKKMLIARGLFGTTALFFYFHTLGHIPFANAATIQQLAPLFTTFLCALFIGEKFFKTQILFFAISLIGIIFIRGFETEGVSLPYLWGLISSFTAACAYTVIRKLGSSEDPMVIIFYFPLVIIPVSLPFNIIYWVEPSWTQYLYLILVGVSVQLAQYFMTRSYQLAEAGIVSIVNYLGVVWAVILGIVFFKENLEFSTALGIVLVMLGIIGNAWRKSRASRELTP